MTAYRTASFFRVATYLRLKGIKKPLGFFYVQDINPIKDDLVDLRIVPTAKNRGFLIHMEDHDCATLPIELKYVDRITAKGICQFIVDHSQGPVYVNNDEQPIWQDLFDKINYDISFRYGKLQLRGLNGYNLNI